MMSGHARATGGLAILAHPEPRRETSGAMAKQRTPDPFGDPNAEVTPAEREIWQAEVRRLIALMATHAEPYSTTSAGLDIVVMPKVFSPAYFTDSEWFATGIAALAGKGRLLDVGTGTGIVALLAHLNGASAVATDINPHAVENARRNFEKFGLSIPVYLGDVYAAVPAGEEFDLIFWNHPFNRGTRLHEDELSLCGFDYEYRGLTRFIQDAHYFLTDRGRLILGTSTFAEVSLIERIARDAGYAVNILSRKECPLQWRGPAVTELRLCEFVPR